jgi:hypothetical protein
MNLSVVVGFGLSPTMIAPHIDVCGTNHKQLKLDMVVRICTAKVSADDM